MKTPVSIDIAIILKEKGFNEPTNHYTQKSAVIGDETILPIAKSTKAYDWNNYGKRVPYYSIPTIADVVMWLYEKHGIWISLFPKDICKDEWTYVYEFGLFQGYFKETIYSFTLDLEHLNSPTEAYSQAIEYVIKNLI